MGRLREYTRIKHTVLIDIFARGLLSKREMQIAFVVIRESWGWDGGGSNWTKQRLSHRCIAKLTGIDRRSLIKIVRAMLNRNMLAQNDVGQYRFNEHVDTWVCQKATTKAGGKKPPPPCGKKTHGGCGKKPPPPCGKKTPKRILGTPALSYSLKGLRQLTKLPKERFKERFKETLKEMPSFLRNYYQIKINRKLRVFGETRRKMILNRLENFCLQELITVVDNISKSDWHMGRDPKTQGAKQNDFELLFRSDVQVEKYLHLEMKKPDSWEDKYK